MCEIIAIVANQDVGVRVSWAAHQLGAADNPDGWGAAWIEDGQFDIKKAPKALPPGAKGLDLVKGISTTQFIGHTRYKVQGERSMENTQPFVSPDKRCAFAGTMRGCNAKKRFGKEVGKRLVGETGPEILFQFILANLEKHGDAGLKLAVNEFFSAKSLPKNASASFVLCTPEDTYVFRFGKSLYYCLRVPPHEDRTVLLRGQIHKPYRLRLKKSKTPNVRAVTIIATEELTSEQWHSVDENKLFSVTFNGLNPAL